MIELDCYNCVTCGQPCSSKCAAGPWIPVGERLPLGSARCLVLIDTGGEADVAVAGCWRHATEDRAEWVGVSYPVTHWAEIRWPK